MDHKAVFNIFKSQYTADGYFPFSLFPVLFLELTKYGADKSHFTGDFVADFLATFMPNDTPAVHVKAIDCLQHYSREYLPALVKKTEIAKIAESTQKVEIPLAIEQPKPQAARPTPPPAPVKAVENVGLPKIDYDGYIPTDEEEGDGTYIPESERLYLKPEECAPMQLDHEWLKEIGAVGYGEDDK